jgi:hypothetical protein
MGIGFGLVIVGSVLATRPVRAGSPSRPDPARNPAERERTEPAI